ncbi:MAG: VWA domain-containing protein [Planctomycetaceae bacterium]
MLTFIYPELFLLAIPLWWAYQRFGRATGVTGGLRVALLVLFLLALTGPLLNLSGSGTDVVVVVDRSRSIREDDAAHIQELIRILEEGRGTGDRVGLVTFGQDARIEQQLAEKSQFADYAHQVSPDGSDLHAGLLSALTLVQDDRPARILVLSDGEANGPNPDSAARRCRDAGVPVDYRLFERLNVGDTAIESVLLPDTVNLREPFQLSVWIHADKVGEGTVRLLRNGKPISQSKQEFHIGENRVIFRDVLESPGIHTYSAQLDIQDDLLLENNKGLGVVRAEAGPRLLVLNEDGQEDNLVRALLSGQLPVDVAAAKDFPLTHDALDPYRAVIVENVPARQFGRIKMERLAQFVEDLGGGLMLTGGERSFGTGGYFKSPLDDVLPVSMEMREEHRKNRLALVIALDRSGSMAVPVSGGKVKMDLANLGTVECLKMLSPGDSVAVIAVDSSPHIIVPMTPVEDPEAMSSKVKRIESMGGGIFIYEALTAAGQELMKAEQSTKHIILFSDANDSEEPGAYKSLLEKFAEAGITCSVIGLGTKTDVDSALLEDIARRGKGNIMFTTDPEELPRLFTEDTMSVARSSFIEFDPKTQPNGIPGKMLPDAVLMGSWDETNFPTVGGYNLSYLKPEATVAVTSQDEYAAPWSAFWYRGLGRVAAITLEVDGKHAGGFGQWGSYSNFMITHARWLLGGDEPSSVYVRMEQVGQEAVVNFELDPDRPDTARQAPTFHVLPPGDERQKPFNPDLVWTGPYSLEARFRLAESGTYRTLIQTGPRGVQRGPAVSLPYSPEFAPRTGLRAGTEILKASADLTEGKSRPEVLDIFRDPPRSVKKYSLVPWLAIAGLCILLMEIAGRRLSLWERIMDVLTPEELAQATTPSAKVSPVKVPLRERIKRLASKKATAKPVTVLKPGEPPTAPAAPEPTTPSLVDVYAKAKQQTRNRMK